MGFIYKIENKQNGKIYIGKTVNTIRERWLEHTEDKDSGTDVERPSYSIWNLTLRSHALNAKPSEDVWEEIAHERTSVAQEALDRVCLGLLLVVNHIADHHLERLHRHIDRGIEEHKHNGTKGERRLNDHIETTRIWQERHNDNGNQSTHIEVRLTATPLAPGFVAHRADDRLYDHTHQRRQYPEETKGVGISTQCRKDAADVCTLQSVGNLHAKESETQIPHLAK